MNPDDVDEDEEDEDANPESPAEDEGKTSTRRESWSGADEPQRKARRRMMLKRRKMGMMTTKRSERMTLRMDVILCIYA